MPCGYLYLLVGSVGLVTLHAAPSLQKAMTQTFRANQATAGDAAAAAIRRLWNAGFSIKSARASWAAMRPAVMAVVSRYYAASQASGQVYYNACRLISGLGPLPPNVKVKVPLTNARADNVIDPCGLGAFLHQVKGGARMMDAYVSGRESLASAAQGLVLAGARDWIEAAAAADPKAAGVRRVPGGTCDYCENLAGQGVTVADSGWHNDCQCTSEPAFGDDTGPSPSLPDSGTNAAPDSDAVEAAPDGVDDSGLDQDRSEPVIGATDAGTKNEVLEAINAKYPIAGLNEVLHTPEAMTEAVTVPVEDLTGTMTSLDSDTVKKYMADIASGKPVPPGLAVKIDGKTYVVDGNHRVDAQIRSGISDVPLQFIKGVGEQPPGGQQ